MRNTAVNATIKVNGKPQSLGTRSPQTPESIDLKFNLDDYVGGVTLRAKMVRYKSAQQGRRGKKVKYNVQLGYFVFFNFLPSSGEHTFVSIAVFLHWMTCFGGD